MSNSPTPEGEDPADLLDRTNLAAYLSARKQLAAENSTLGLPTRPVLLLGRFEATYLAHTDLT